MRKSKYRISGYWYIVIIAIVLMVFVWLYFEKLIHS
jgi:Mg2+ and Co2+ transporter CorA